MVALFANRLSNFVEPLLFVQIGVGESNKVSLIFLTLFNRPKIRFEPKKGGLHQNWIGHVMCFFSLEILPRFPNTYIISKSYYMFVVLNQCFAAELLSKQSKGSEL